MTAPEAPRTTPRDAAVLLVERGTPCKSCLARPAKYLGWIGYGALLCLECYAVRRLSWERREIEAGRMVAGCLIGPRCPGCGSGRVDADGVRWWCSDCDVRMGWREGVTGE
jgi:hypothetical protein